MDLRTNPRTGPRLERSIGCIDRLRRAALAIVLAVTAACATTPELSTLSFEELRDSLVARDFDRATRLIQANPADLDFARALDISIRLGDAEAVSHFLPRVGPDAHLDPDHTTPLIRAIVAAPAGTRQQLVEILLDAGADGGRADRFGRDARDYAVTRAEFEIARMLGAPGVGPRSRFGKEAIERWLPPATLPGASLRQVGAQGAGAAAGPATWGPTATDAEIAAARAAAVRAERVAAATTQVDRTDTGADRKTFRRLPAPLSAPLGLSVADLLRQSPWVPSAAALPREGVAALRFHGDGTADVLRYRAATDRFEPLVGAYAAWRLQREHLRIAVVGRQFSAHCVGTGRVGNEVALACSDHETPTAPDPSLRLAGVDGARVVLTGLLGSLEVGDDDHVMTVIRPHGGTTCTPSANRPAPPQAASGTRLGDWHVFDSRRFEVHAPLTGRACQQTEARQVALQSCSAASKECVSLGGCMAGQVSAVAAMPGVDAGWLACGIGYDDARRKALEACRAQLGCECQLVAIFGENINTSRDPICRVRP
jgi:hypothetical protein